MRVLIDAGHGIETPGKRSPDGAFLEYLWNRNVAALVLSEMRKRGIDAELLVTESNDIPLRTRVERVNATCSELGTDNVLLVSIHSNAYGEPGKWTDPCGWSCYTSPGQTGSDKVAECLYAVFERAFPDRRIRREMTDGDSDYEANFYVLTKSRCKAVLLENFFYSNREECRWLLQKDTKIRIAEAICEGIMLYLCER